MVKRKQRIINAIARNEKKNIVDRDEAMITIDEKRRRCAIKLGKMKIAWNLIKATSLRNPKLTLGEKHFLCSSDCLLYASMEATN